MYSIIPTSTISRSQPVPHLSVDVVLNSLYSHNHKLTNKWSLSCHHASLQIDLLQVLLQSHSIIPCKCISKLAWSRPQSVSLSSLDLGLQVHVQTLSIMASKSISQFTQSWSPIASPNSHDQGLRGHLQTRSITAFQCISEFTPSWPPSASPNLLDGGLPMHL